MSITSAGIRGSQAAAGFRAFTFAIGDHLRILPTPGHTPGHVAFAAGRGKVDAVFCGDIMHSPLQTGYPELDFMSAP
jgi:glyoxylase-like metal-dependent hydrolase (beta-lactamase superfamily II)